MVFFKKMIIRLKIPAFALTLFFFPFTHSVKEINSLLSKFWFLDMLLFILLGMARIMLITRNVANLYKRLNLS